MQQRTFISSWCFFVLLAVSWPTFLPSAAAAKTAAIAIAEPGCDSRPNIILVNLDDADVEMMSRENLQAHYPCLDRLAKRAIHLTNAHCTTPFCAPSRAALFTGKYAFSNGCKVGSPAHSTSNGFAGGYGEFKRRGHHENELGVWLRQAGYHTIHIGKFHHAHFDMEVPPGWNDFSSTNGIKYYGANIFTNIGVPETIRFSATDEQYISHINRGLIETSLTTLFADQPDKPFFLSLAPIAPHTQGTNYDVMVEPKYLDYANDLSQPTDAPDFNEADISDKPFHLQRPTLKPEEIRKNQGAYLGRLRSVKSVDDMLQATLQQIDEAGKLDNTIVVVTSDNGYSLGHHRVSAKKDPYNRSTNVPLMIAMPGRTVASSGRHLIAHIDICPTILELASAVIPDDVDGKSFAPLLDRPDQFDEQSWQESIMIENWSNKQSNDWLLPMTYAAERRFDSIFVGWANGQREFYDLSSDPFQLENSYGDLAPLVQGSLVESLRSFRGMDVTPNLTIASPVPGDSVGSEIQFSGFAEDNSAALLSKLTIRSFATGRFYDGDKWVTQPTHIRIPVDAPEHSVTDWSESIKIYTETVTNIDYLICYAQAIDDSGKFGSFDSTINMIEGMSMFARFNPSIDGKTFESGKAVRLSGYIGERPNSQVKVVVYRKSDGRYFNGNEFQASYTSIRCDLLENHRWGKSLNLPSGRYRAFLRAWLPSSQLYQRHPEIADFDVD